MSSDTNEQQQQLQESFQQQQVSGSYILLILIGINLFVAIDIRPSPLLETLSTMND